MVVLVVVIVIVMAATKYCKAVSGKTLLVFECSFSSYKPICSFV